MMTPAKPRTAQTSRKKRRVPWSDHVLKGQNRRTVPTYKKVKGKK